MTFPLTPRIYTPVIVITSLLWLFQLKRSGASFRVKLLKWTYLSFAAMYAVQLVGLAYTNEWTESLKDLETKSSLLVLPALVLFSGLTLQQIRGVHWMFTLSILVMSIYLLVCSIRRATNTGDGLVQVVSGNLYQTTYFTTPLDIHPTYLSLFACLAVFFIADSFNGKKSWQKVLMVLTILFLILINFILLSRGALIGFAMGGFGLILHRFAVVDWKPVIVISVTVTFVILVAAAFIYIPNFKHRFTDQVTNLSQYWQGYHPDNSTSLHLYSWKCSLTLIRERPLFGYGTGDEVERLLGCYQEHNLTKSLENRYNAHNEFLSTMLRHGLFGLLVTVAFFAYALAQAIRHRDSLLIAVLILFLVVSLFESTLNVYRGVVFLALFVSLLIRRCALRARSIG